MERATLSISAAGETFNGYLAAPESGRGPGLLLLPDIIGLGPQARELADFYAEEGYLVLVPDLFRHLRSGGESTCRLDHELDVDRATGELEAAVAMLRKSAACTGRVGVLGWCLGGTLAGLALAWLSLDAAVAYCPTGLGRHLDELRTIRGPLVVHFGAEDAMVDADGRASIKQALAGDDAAEIYVYPEAGHSFSERSEHGFQKGAASLAHSRTIGLLRRTIGPRYDLETLWERHLEGEFIISDPDATIRTMVERPYVNHVPTMIGGLGRDQLYRYYKHHFIPQAKGSRMIPVSRTIGPNRLVDEFVACFRHDTPNDTLLPGVEPTGKEVRLPMIVVVQFRGDKLCAERIYWDQASLLAQVGLLDCEKLPVTGADAAASVLDETVPLNKLRADRWWKNSEGQN